MAVPKEPRGIAEDSIRKKSACAQDTPEQKAQIQPHGKADCAKAKEESDQRGSLRFSF